MLPLNFYEYIDMKKFLNKNIDTNIYHEFEEFIRNGGVPGSLYYDNYNDRLLYTKVGSIYDNLRKNEMLKVDCSTIKNYIDLLEKVKIIYPCELFDLKSKMVLDSEKNIIWQI